MPSVPYLTPSPQKSKNNMTFETHFILHQTLILWRCAEPEDAELDEDDEANDVAGRDKRSCSDATGRTTAICPSFLAGCTFG